MKPNKYDSYIEKLKGEMKNSKINEISKREPNLSKSVDDRSIFQRMPEPNLPKLSLKNYNHYKLDFENEKLKEDLDVLLRSSEKFNQSFMKQKSPRKMNEIKGINYNYVNRNKRDDVKGLLFMDKSYKNPIEKVYEDFDNPLKINKKDYIETISNPKPSISQMPLIKNDISSYDILKKKMVNYIHFNIHKESIDDKIMDKANKIRECEEKKFLMSKVISDHQTMEKFNAALEKRILVSFNEVHIYLFHYYIK